jgi:amino acid permease
MTASSDAASTESISDNNFNPTQPLHQSTPKCPSPGAISNLCSATLGAGALSLPYAFSLTGLIPGVILLLLSGYLTILSIDVIISSCVHTTLFKYEDVAVRLVGRWAGRALEASLLVFCFGTAVAYIVAVGDILDQFLRSILNERNDDCWMSFYSRDRVMILFWLLVMFPLSLQRHMEGLERFSSLGVLSIIFLVLAAVIHSIQNGEILARNTDTDTTSHKSTSGVDISTMLWPDSFWDIVQAFPIVIFAFSCQVNVCAIFEELSPGNDVLNCDDATIKERMMKRISRYGITLCITLYLAIGIFGYLDFENETVSSILSPRL